MLYLESSYAPNPVCRRNFNLLATTLKYKEKETVKLTVVV